jgi:hypothetical protein
MIEREQKAGNSKATLLREEMRPEERVKQARETIKLVKAITAQALHAVMQLSLVAGGTVSGGTHGQASLVCRQIQVAASLPTFNLFVNNFKRCARGAVRSPFAPVAPPLTTRAAQFPNHPPQRELAHAVLRGRRLCDALGASQPVQRVLARGDVCDAPLRRHRALVPALHPWRRVGDHSRCAAPEGASVAAELTRVCARAELHFDGSVAPLFDLPSYFRSTREPGQASEVKISLENDEPDEVDGADDASTDDAAPRGEDNRFINDVGAWRAWGVRGAAAAHWGVARRRGGGAGFGVQDGVEERRVRERERARARLCVRGRA